MFYYMEFEPEDLVMLLSFDEPFSSGAAIQAATRDLIEALDYSVQAIDIILDLRSYEPGPDHALVVGNIAAQIASLTWHPMLRHLLVASPDSALNQAIAQRSRGAAEVLPSLDSALLRARELAA